MFHRVGPAAYKPGLENTIQLMEAIGNPQREMACIHVAGTNGKGSTSHLIASILQSAGYRVGLYTSPHLKDFRERIRVNGQMIEKDFVTDFVEKHKASWSHIQPSFFEITVALCFDYFNLKKTDVAVIETGLGGRLDSTNVIDPLVSVITNVSMDHMNLLGDTIEAIAIEKAGIIKRNRPVVIGPMIEQAKTVMLERARNIGATPIFAHNELSYLFEDCPLKGNYQQQNFETVGTTIQVLRTLGFEIKDSDILSGANQVIAVTGLMGRWQILGKSPLIVADVAHNEDGIKMVMQQISETTHLQLHVVLGMVADKDITRVLGLLPSTAKYYFCKADIPRGLAAEELKVQAHEFGLMGEVFDSVSKAFQAARDAAEVSDMVFIGGSIFTVAEVL
jgi:dihydrofolate synthase / folylpolyglutamate synthase